MNSGNLYRKPISPRASTEVISLQKNKSLNRDALERGLLRRRPVSELINQGILLNPSVSNAFKVKELQRAKTADFLRHKIEKRPDKQALINQRILKSCDGTSPFIQERCNVLTKNLLYESLNDKLEKRPGSLELVEKGVLEVDPGVATLIRGGSIPYPRVASTSPTIVVDVPDVAHIPVASPVSQSPHSSTVSYKSRAHRRSLKDETVISRYGSLVFHNYCPSSATSSSSPSLGGKGGGTAASPRWPKHRAREAQQAELLHLEGAAQIHKRLGEEICQLRRPTCPSVPEEVENATQATPLNTAVFQSVVYTQPTQQCFVITSPTASSSSDQHGIIDASNGALLTFTDAPCTEVRLDLDHPAIGAMAPPSQEPASSQPEVASLEVIESVWVDLRRLQQDITEEGMAIGLKIYTSDGFPGAFNVATAGDVELFNAQRNHPSCQRFNALVREHASACSLARLLISDRLEYLDAAPLAITTASSHDSVAAAAATTSSSGSQGGGPLVGSDLERNLLHSYLHRLGGSYYQKGAARQRRVHHLARNATASDTTNNTAAASSYTIPQACWRNSTILPAQSETMFYQQQRPFPSECFAVDAKDFTDGLAKVVWTTSASTEDWFSKLAPQSGSTTAAAAIFTNCAIPTTNSLYTTTSVPAHLDVAAHADSRVDHHQQQHAFYHLGKKNGSDCSSSGAILTADSSVSSSALHAGGLVSTAAMGKDVAMPLRGTQEDLMAFEMSSSILDPQSSPVEPTPHLPPYISPSLHNDLSDVQDFLNAFPFEEHSAMGQDVLPCGAAIPSSGSQKTVLPPGPQYFASAFTSQPQTLTLPDVFWMPSGVQSPDACNVVESNLMETS